MGNRSKKFYTYEADGEYISVGSPSDIRKEMKRLEEEGFYNLYCDKPIMREGRIYTVRWAVSPSDGHTYCVGRL